MRGDQEGPVREARGEPEVSGGVIGQRKRVSGSGRRVSLAEAQGVEVACQFRKHEVL